MHNILCLTPRPSLSRVWVPVKIGSHNQLICKWITAQTTSSNPIDSDSRPDDPPALAA